MMPEGKLPRPVDLGFDVKEVATWDPGLVRDPRMLVPVHVDALVVRQTGPKCADCRFRSASEAGSTSSIDRLPPPFAEQDARPRGVHLHWAMPDALTTLRGSGDRLDPPALPDVWLVVRIAPGQAGLRVPTAWILEARTGRVTPLESWSAQPPEGDVITALGAGDLGWAAYYDNVIGRFAFHDALEGVERGPLTYLVSGWYADPATDPLASRGQRSVADFENRLAELRWGLSDDDLALARTTARRGVERAAASGLETPHAVRTAEGRVAWAEEIPAFDSEGRPVGGAYAMAAAYGPQATLCHGTVVGISWPNLAEGSVEVGGPPPASEVAVAIGSTPADAFASLVAQASGSHQDADLLTAFAHGGLSDLRQPDARIKLEDRLHDAGFVARRAGSKEVQRTPITTPPGERPPSAGPKAARIGRAEIAWNDIKQAAFLDLHASPPKPPPAPPERTLVRLPEPRSFLPADPVLAIQGARRSLKHGGDGRFDPGGRLVCRISGSTVKGLGLRVLQSGERTLVQSHDVLAAHLSHGALPPECEQLLFEAALIDPGGAQVVAEAARNIAGAAAPSTDAIARTAVTEQTAWWAARDPEVDLHAILAHSGLDGKVPSPIAVRPAQRPWVPLHVDWQVEYIEDSVTSWTPGEIDFEPGSVPDATGRLLSGRTLLSPGAATALADAMRDYTAVAERTDTSDLRPTGFAARAMMLIRSADPAKDDFSSLADRLAALDILTGSLEHFHLRLRGRVRPDPVEGPAPAAPLGFVALRSGFLRIVRLRLVDAFGQVLDLAGSSAESPVDAARIVVSEPMRVDGAPGRVALPPRFTAPTRVHFRFVDADHPEQDADESHSPVCGWLLPDHLDGAVEVFDAQGRSAGQLRVDPLHGGVWDPVPGVASAVGEAPRERLTHPVMAGIVQTLFERGMSDPAAAREPVLSAWLRLVDSTRWTIDPFGHTGEEHLALLLGHPVAVVRATLKLDVREPAANTGVELARVPVRLGALTHWQDGLFGYFVDGDYGRFHAAAAAAQLARPTPRDGFLGPIDEVPDYAAGFSSDVGNGGSTPVDHPYIDTSGTIWVVPQITYQLVLLMEPHCAVHATAGFVPRKAVGLRREWMAPALARLAPTFRFGPVLRDPRQMRMPIPADLGGAWTWSHREEVDRWSDEEVVHSAKDAKLSPDPSVAQEGWLRFTPNDGEG